MKAVKDREEQTNQISSLTKQIQQVHIYVK